MISMLYKEDKIYVLSKNSIYKKNEKTGGKFMKMMKQAAAWTMAVAMGVSSLSGCGKQGEEVSIKAEESITTYHYTGEAPITDQEGVSVSMLAQNSWYSTVDFASAPIIQEVAKRAGVNIDWTLISPTNYKDSVMPMLASGTDLPDIVELPDLDPNMNYLKSGLFVALDEYMDDMPNYKKFLDEHPDIKASLTAEDGHIYYVPQTVVTNNYQPCMMINQKWLEKIGKEIPKTLDEFVEVLRLFKEQDMNGNGDPNDEIPMSVMGNNTPSYLLYMFGPAFGLDLASGFYADDNGKVHYAFAEGEQYKEYLEFVHSLYEEGLLEVEFTTLTRDQVTERCANDLTGVTFDFSWQMSQLYSAQYSDYTGEEGIMVGMPPLSGEYEGFYLARQPFANIFGVSSNSKNKQNAIRFLDYAMSEECQELYVWGIEGESYTTSNDGTKAYTDKAQDSLWLQGLGINPGCLPSQQSVEATDVLLPEWHVAIDKELEQYMRDPWPFIYATEEESAIVSQYLVDITTYVEEMHVAFITGTASLDAFDNYLDSLKSMNLDELLKVRQTQYDRYKAANQ